jgi:hypothetical protein
MRVYWSDIIYMRDEVREIRVFARKDDRDAHIAVEVASYQFVEAKSHEWDSTTDIDSEGVVVYYEAPEG